MIEIDCILKILIRLFQIPNYIDIITRTFSKSYLFRLSSMVEQSAVNRQVAGSSPAGGAS